LSTMNRPLVDNGVAIAILIPPSNSAGLTTLRGRPAAA